MKFGLLGGRLGRLDLYGCSVGLEVVEMKIIGVEAQIHVVMRLSVSLGRRRDSLRLMRRRGLVLRRTQHGSMIGQAEKLDVIANNLANSNTAGFRAEETKFEAMLGDESTENVHFSSSGDTYITREAGSLTKTDNPLDVAVQGNAWFAVQTPSGTVYTRDGRMPCHQHRRLPTHVCFTIGPTSRRSSLVAHDQLCLQC